MPKLFTRSVALLLAACLVADPVLSAAAPVVSGRLPHQVHQPYHTEFDRQALSSLAAFFTHEDRPNLAESRVVHWLLGGAAVLLAGAAGYANLHHSTAEVSLPVVQKGLLAIAGVTVAALSTVIQSGPEDRYAWDRRIQREMWAQYPSLRGPKKVTWKDQKKVEQSLELTYEIADSQPETIQQIYDVVINFTGVLKKNGLLTEGQIEMIEAYRTHPKVLQRTIRKAIRGTPWAMVAKDPAGRIVAVVFPALGPHGTASALAPTMRGMLRWHKPLGRSSKWIMVMERRRMMADYWFMAYDYRDSEGHGTIAESMLDKSVEIAQRLGIRRFFAYSNPVGYPTFALKHPNPDIVDYTARVLAATILRRLLPIAKQGGVTSWEKLFPLIMQMSDDHAVGELSTKLGGKITVALAQFATDHNFPVNPTPQDFYQLLTSFAQLYDKGGYTVNEPALGIHLRRGLKMSRIIKGAFRNFHGMPEIGGGFSIDLEMDLPLLPEYKYRGTQSLKYWVAPALLLGGALVGIGYLLAKRDKHREPVDEDSSVDRDPKNRGGRFPWLQDFYDQAEYRMSQRIERFGPKYEWISWVWGQAILPTLIESGPVWIGSELISALYQWGAGWPVIWGPSVTLIVVTVILRVGWHLMHRGRSLFKPEADQGLSDAFHWQKLIISLSSLFLLALMLPGHFSLWVGIGLVGVANLPPHFGVDGFDAWLKILHPKDPADPSRNYVMARYKDLGGAFAYRAHIDQEKNIPLLVKNFIDKLNDYARAYRFYFPHNTKEQIEYPSWRSLNVRANMLEGSNYETFVRFASYPEEPPALEVARHWAQGEVLIAAHGTQHFIDMKYRLGSFLIMPQEVVDALTGKMAFLMAVWNDPVFDGNPKFKRFWLQSMILPSLGNLNSFVLRLGYFVEAYAPDKTAADYGSMWITDLTGGYATGRKLLKDIDEGRYWQSFDLLLEERDVLERHANRASQGHVSRSELIPMMINSLELKIQTKVLGVQSPTQTPSGTKFSSKLRQGLKKGGSVIKFLRQMQVPMKERSLEKSLLAAA